MSFKRNALLAASLLTVVLAGCASKEEGARAPAASGGSTPAVAGDGRCDADRAAFAVGQPATAALLEQARQRSGSQVARILHPGDAVTLEYRSDRLNLNTDAAGKVERANCG